MLKKMLATFGIDLVAKAPTPTMGLYKPYSQSHANFLYNLLFCDDIELFKNQNNVKTDGLWSTLLAENPDKDDLRKIANSETNEGRVRALAYNRLRLAGDQVPARELLGVIVEVPLRQGLDTLAAYSEGGVRYLNQSGKVAIFEGRENPVEALAKELVSTAQPLTDRIGPWNKQRRPPPKEGNVRLTFLVSDGLYFGEGPFASLQKDAMAGPVIASATKLLQRAVELGTK